MVLRRVAILLGIVLGCLFLVAAPASAHAELVRSDPSAHAVLSKPPAEIRLWFSEQIEAGASPATLIGADGKAVPGVRAAVAADDVQQMLVRLPELKSGHYLLRWRAISADGHPIQGSIPFQVGLDAGARPDFAALLRDQAGAGTGPPGVAGSAWAWPLARWVMVASALLLAGAMMLPLLVAWPGRTPDGPLAAAEPLLARRYRVLLGVAGAGFALGNLGLLALQAAAQAETPVSLVWRADAIGKVAMQTKFGLLVLARVGLVAIGLGAAGWLQLRDRWAGFAFGATMLLTLSLGGHAVARPGISPVIADWLHLIAIAPWVAGLAIGVAALFPGLSGLSAGERRAALAALVPRFSRLAAGSVTVAVGTGVYASFLHVPDPGALVRTPYGRALLTKLALVAPLLLLGLFNLWLGRARLQRPGPDGERATLSLRRAVWVEVAVCAGVVTATAVLIGLPPARQATAGVVPVISTQHAGEFQVTMRLEPNRPGYNSLEVFVQGPGGTPVRDLKVSTFGFMPEHRHMTEQLEMPSRGDGRYRLDQLILMPGHWQHHVVIRRGQEEQHALLDVVTPE